MNSRKHILTQHLKDRVKERGISQDELDAVLDSPDMRYPGKKGETNLVKTVATGRKIRVVCKEGRDKIKVITAMVR